MPRYQLTWTEEILFRAEVTARDRLQAKQMWDNWDSEVSDSAKEIDFLNKGEVKVEVIRRNANINSID